MVHPSMPLASVSELHAETSDPDDATASSGQHTSGGSIGSTPAKTGLKRSPYLSQMTQTADSDLMARLSRPEGHVVNSRMGGMGGVDFFSLRRPPQQTSGGPQGRSERSASVDNTASKASRGGQAMPSALRGGSSSSALRSASQLRTVAEGSAAEGGPDVTNTGSGGGMKKNSSVTFSQNTKQGSSLGLATVAAGAASGNPSNAMANSQGGGNAPFTDPQDASVGAPARSGVQDPQQGGMKNQFPLYLDNLTKDTQHSKSTDDIEPNSPQRPTPGQHRTKSKSTTTLQYYYKPLLQSVGVESPSPLTAHSFKSLGNLTFREMLDEGDGKEGDLNVRLRNEQWKVFRRTEDGDDGMANVNDKFNKLSVTNNNNNMFGLKRSNTPSTSNESSLDTMGACNVNSNNNSPAVNRGTVNNNIPPMTMIDHPQMALPKQHQLIGSHRGCVSAHDLAVFRRSASRMKMNNPSGATSTAPHVTMSQMNPSTPQRPGEMLGASMLSRLSSMDSSNGSSPNISMRDVTSLNVAHPSQSSIQSVSGSANPFSSSGTNDASSATGTSPLAQMMAKKFNMNNSAPRPSGMPLMGRRVHTISAGLAYGSVGFQMDSTTRISKFDLRNNPSALSISSGGSGAGGYGKNEEWS